MATDVALLPLTTHQIVSDIAISDPCVIFALGREARSFLRGFPPQQRFRGAPCWAKFCGPSWLSVLVLRTGVGPARAERALDWLVKEPKLEDVPYRPRLVISAGYSGSLQEHLKIGDVILANEVVDLDGGRCPITWPEELPAGEWRPPLIRARILTAERLIGDPNEKRSLGNRLDAVAVDMESAVIARACSRAGVPFGCVRVISDEVQTPVSRELISLLSSDRVSPLHAVTAILGSPRLALEMGRLARATRLASLQLGKALGELLTLTLPFGAQLE